MNSDNFLKFLLLPMFKIIDQGITIFMGDFFVVSIPCILKMQLKPYNLFKSYHTN